MEVLLLAERLGFEVEDCPVEWTNSPESKVRIVGDSWGCCATPGASDAWFQGMSRRETKAVAAAQPPEGLSIIYCPAQNWLFTGLM